MGLNLVSQLMLQSKYFFYKITERYIDGTALVPSVCFMTFE